MQTMANYHDRRSFVVVRVGIRLATRCSSLDTRGAFGVLSGSSLDLIRVSADQRLSVKTAADLALDRSSLIIGCRALPVPCGMNVAWASRRPGARTPPCFTQTRPRSLGLGGEPDWIQADETPDCPSCAAYMTFIASWKRATTSPPRRTSAAGAAVTLQLPALRRGRVPLAALTPSLPKSCPEPEPDRFDDEGAAEDVGPSGSRTPLMARPAVVRELCPTRAIACRSPSDLLISADQLSLAMVGIRCHLYRICTAGRAGHSAAICRGREVSWTSRPAARSYRP
jgi:hypothetical protein